jgi:hypothetical protein
VGQEEDLQGTKLTVRRTGFFVGDRAMATIALPIRELSATVQYDAASAQKAFWEVVESKRREALFDFVIYYMTRRLNRRMTRLAKSQSELVERLRQLPAERMAAPEFSKVADDLFRIVAMTDSIAADCYEMPDQCTDVWRSNLEKVADQSNHIESFAETFRIAANETCTALLADIAQKVMAREAIPA